jgi:Phage tail lysozyme
VGAFLVAASAATVAIVATALVVITGRPGSPTDPLGVAMAEVQTGRAGASLEFEHQEVVQEAAATNAFTATSAPKMSSSTYLRCVSSAAGGSDLLPLNYATIVNFLVGNGYTSIAAAGIAGNIYQESGGNPESGDGAAGGLIGWTPLPSGYITGNPSADLQTQLEGLLAFNDHLGEFLPALNAATTPADAAYVYMTDFERPSLPAASNREDAAIAVAAACGFTS